MRLLETKYFNEYVRTQGQLLQFVQKGTLCPHTITVMASHALNRLRQYLDENGVKMPAPRYMYNHSDESTWMYLPTEANAGLTRVCWNNPSFKYRAK